MPKELLQIDSNTRFAPYRKPACSLWKRRRANKLRTGEQIHGAQLNQDYIVQPPTEVLQQPPSHASGQLPQNNASPPSTLGTTVDTSPQCSGNPQPGAADLLEAQLETQHESRIHRSNRPKPVPERQLRAREVSSPHQDYETPDIPTTSDGSDLRPTSPEETLSADPPKLTPTPISSPSQTPSRPYTEPTPAEHADSPPFRSWDMPEPGSFWDAMWQKGRELEERRQEHDFMGGCPSPLQYPPPPDPSPFASFLHGISRRTGDEDPWGKLNLSQVIPLYDTSTDRESGQGVEQELAARAKEDESGEASSIPNHLEGEVVVKIEDPDEGGMLPEEQGFFGHGLPQPGPPENARPNIEMKRSPDWEPVHPGADIPQEPAASQTRGPAHTQATDSPPWTLTNERIDAEIACFERKPGGRGSSSKQPQRKRAREVEVDGEEGKETGEDTPRASKRPRRARLAGESQPEWRDRGEPVPEGVQNEDENGHGPPNLGPPQPRRSERIRELKGKKDAFPAPAPVPPKAKAKTKKPAAKLTSRKRAPRKK